MRLQMPPRVKRADAPADRSLRHAPARCPRRLPGPKTALPSFRDRPRRPRIARVAGQNDAPTGLRIAPRLAIPELVGMHQLDRPRRLLAAPLPTVVPVGAGAIVTGCMLFRGRADDRALDHAHGITGPLTGDHEGQRGQRDG